VLVVLQFAVTIRMWAGPWTDFLLLALLMYSIRAQPVVARPRGS